MVEEDEIIQLVERIDLLNKKIDALRKEQERHASNGHSKITDALSSRISAIERKLLITGDVFSRS